MDRNTLVLYLKEVRDLEFAKNKINSMYHYEKRKFEREEKELLNITYYKVPEFESGWTTGIKVAIVIGIILVIASVYLMTLGTAIFWFLGGLSSAWLLIVIPIQMAIQDTASNKQQIENALYHNEKESQREKNNTKIYNQLKVSWEKRSAYLLSEYNKVVNLFIEYYSVNILANQYRNIQSVYYIYDYMSSSQETLKDTLMHEHMENGIQRVLERLDTIIRQNETIILQNRIEAATNEKLLNQTGKMLDSLRRSESNMELAVQYSQISANYSKANAYFSLANYLK